MGDIVDYYKDVNAYLREMRRVFGVPCPRCSIARPKAQASILLPGEKCKVDGYRDPRDKEALGIFIATVSQSTKD